MYMEVIELEWGLDACTLEICMKAAKPHRAATAKMMLFISERSLTLALPFPSTM